MKKITWTTHHAVGYVVHADSKWNNGNSAAGIALAISQHERGTATDHVVHAPGAPCGHCSASA